ncbi:MAG: hypothetical protein R3F60_19080 [bacterium]
MKTWWMQTRDRWLSTLRALTSLGAVFPGDEEQDWHVAPAGRVVPVEFPRAEGARRAPAVG